MKMSSLLIRIAKKFEAKYSFGQEVLQQDIGSSEDIAFAHSAAFAKISSYLKSKHYTGCNVKAFLTVKVNNVGMATSVNTDRFDIYCSAADIEIMEKVSAEVLAAFGALTAQNMLHIYQSNPSCRKVLQNQYKENTIPNQSVVVKAQNS